MSELDEFFDTIWSDTEGYVYLPVAERDSKGQIVSGSFKPIYFEWPKHRRAIANHISANAAKGNEVYFGPAIYSAIPPKGKNASKEHIKGSHVLWVDFDGNAPESWDHEPVTVPSARPEDATRTPPPTLRIQSSAESHQHVYWRLDQFVTDVSVIEEKNRALAYLLRADTSGWDANQILRPPESTNHKRGLPVVIAEDNGDQYSLSRFSYLRPAKEVIQTDDLLLDAVVEVEPILAKYTWPEQFSQLFFSDADTLKIDRSASLSQVAYFGAEIGMTDVEIFSLLVDCDDRWGKFVKRKDRQRRLSELVNRARLKHPIPLTSVLVDIGSGAVATEVAPQYVYNFREFVNTEFKFDWLVPGVISRTGSALFASAPGVGKTQFCIRLGMALSVGRTFLKWTPARAAKVLFISLEMGGPALHKFISHMATTETPIEMDALASNFHVVPLGQPIPLDKPAGMSFMEKLLKEYEPDMVIIDSFGQLFSGKLNDDDGIRKIHGDLAGLRQRFNCSMVFIHHNRKAEANNKKPVELGDVFGSQYITSLVDYVASLWKEGDGNIEHRNVKNRLDEESKPFHYKRLPGLDFQLVAEETPVGTEWGGSSDKSDGGRSEPDEGSDRDIFGMG